MPKISNETKTFVDDKIAGKRVVVFSKPSCPYCKQAKEILKGTEYKLTKETLDVLEISGLKNMDEIQDYLHKLTGARSVSLWFCLYDKCLCP